MSSAAVHWAVNVKGLSLSVKQVLIVLAERADGRKNAREWADVCFPSLRDIIERTELSRSTVKRCLKFLRLNGFIEVSHRSTRNGDLTSNAYRVCASVSYSYPIPKHMLGRSKMDRPRSTAMTLPRSTAMTLPNEKKHGVNRMPEKCCVDDPKTEPLVEPSLNTTSLPAGVDASKKQERRWSELIQKHGKEAVQTAWERFLKSAKVQVKTFSNFLSTDDWIQTFAPAKPKKKACEHRWMDSGVDRRFCQICGHVETGGIECQGTERQPVNRSAAYVVSHGTGSTG